MQIYLVYGGKSAEHQLSVAAAFAVLNVIDFQQYQVRLIYVTKTGTWLQGPLLDQTVKTSQDLMLQPVAAPTRTGGLIGQPMIPGNLRAKDAIIFPLIQGRSGEDGKLQGLLEILGLPYVGAGVLASAIGMDKIASKLIFQQLGLPQVPFLPILKNQWQLDAMKVLQRCEGALLYPMYVKPANSGSSVGISQVRDRNSLQTAIELAFQYDQRILVEQGIEARELEVGVMGNQQLEVSGAGEILKDSLFYDTQSKLTPAQPELAIPADIPVEVEQKMQAYAKRAFALIGGSGIARCDFFLTANGTIFLNEINTILNLDPRAMFARLWRLKGYTQERLIQHLLHLALERYQQQAPTTNQ